VRSKVYCASVTRYSELHAVLERAHFITVIDGVFCLGRARDEQT